MSCDRNTSQESWSNVDLEDPFLYLHLVLCGSGPGPRAEGAVCGSGSTPQTLELHNSVLIPPTELEETLLDMSYGRKPSY